MCYLGGHKIDSKFLMASNWLYQCFEMGHDDTFGLELMLSNFCNGLVHVQHTNFLLHVVLKYVSV